ncbi:hypothetical protein A2335_04370 [Candidatus Peregrinibacteria bacterium RIFOXYB2_FULL_32_7]|nr:MAG: hypothetical protein A2335_04370 [Candidatus Peregrinibacteria bacterium RIFOXYB2_FULL_32_7]
MDIILFGMQGSGKGTQGKYIAQRYDLKIFDTGSQLRKLSQEQSSLADKVRKIMEEGRLVPTEVVMEIIENFINENKSGVIFDGIPRSVDQAEKFNQLINKHNRKIKGIFIELTEKEAIKRLSTRRMCPTCKSIFPQAYTSNYCVKCQDTKLITRTDDNLESIKTRLQTYNKETVPVIKTYESTGILNRISGEQKIEKVSQDIFEILDPIMKK